MKKTTLLIVAAASCLLSGCGTPGQTYAKQHPELPAPHRQILMTGKIPDGDAVAGMTREQIQIVMGVDATQYTKVDGHDAWVYVKKRLTSEPFSVAHSDFGQQDNRNRGMPDETAAQSPEGQRSVKTTIIFDGNVATRADVVNGGL